MSTNLNIVICSNTKYLSDLIINLLKQRGYNSLIVLKDKIQLLDFCKKHNPDVVIIDLDSNTFGLNSSTNIIKDLIKIDNNLLILAISDDISEEFKSFVINSGAKEYLCKPFQPANLWERVVRINNIFISRQKNHNSSTLKSNEVHDNDYLHLPKFTQKSNNSFSEDTNYYTKDNYSEENLIPKVNFDSKIEEKKQNKNIFKEIFSNILKK